jgi:hypothetical protein
MAQQDADQLFERKSLPEDLRLREQAAGEIGLGRLDQPAWRLGV